jgi:perosamine synthetase
MKNYILNKPIIGKTEKTYVNDVLNKGWLSSGGTHTKIFEDKFAKFLKIKFALAVQSGTCALHVALKAMGISTGDKVIIPNYSCVANISSISQCNAIPIIVEVERDTLGLDYELVKKAIKIHSPKALQLVHVYGFPARDTEKIINLCKRKKILILEDGSESLGASISKKMIGTFGDISIFSIRSEKMIGVGEGGMILTDNKNLFSKVKLLASRNAPFRSKKDPYWKKYFTLGEGYNYLMPHLLGAVGRAQIEKFEKEILPKKIAIGKNYRIIMKNNFFSFLQKENSQNTSVYWLNCIYFKYISFKKLVRLGEDLMKNGIEVRSGFWPLNKMKKFKSIYVKSRKNISNEIFSKSIVLPSNSSLKKNDLKNIYKILLKTLKKNNLCKSN